MSVLPVNGDHKKSIDGDVERHVLDRTDDGAEHVRHVPILRQVVAERQRARRRARPARRIPPGWRSGGW